MSFWDFFRPSIRLRRAFARWTQKLAGSFYEGPTPPRRLAEEIRLFTAVYPHATRDDWIHYTMTAVANAYRQGFTRGYDWAERGWEGPPDDPERLAELQAHDWSLAEENPAWSRLLTTGYDPHDPLSGSTLDERRAIIETLQGAQQGPFPIEIDLSAYEESHVEEQQEEESDESPGESFDGTPGFRSSESDATSTDEPVATWSSDASSAEGPVGATSAREQRIGGDAGFLRRRVERRDRKTE